MDIIEDRVKELGIKLRLEGCEDVELFNEIERIINIEEVKESTKVWRILEFIRIRVKN